jgi:hypothetical protein
MNKNRWKTLGSLQGHFAAKYVAAQEDIASTEFDREVSSGNPLVAGSSPARPTVFHLVDGFFG